LKNLIAKSFGFNGNQVLIYFNY
jgi:hypothetical protein